MIARDDIILNVGTIFNYIQEHFPETLFWDGYSKHEKRIPSKTYKHRAGLPNEIRIEFDSEDKEKNWKDVHQTSINLYEKNYNFAVFYVEGGRSPHIHIYDCDEMENLSKEQRRIYRRRFIKKFCPKDSEYDLELCDEKHLCALEFAKHFKYNKPKRLIYFFYFGPLSNIQCEKDIYMNLPTEKDLKQPKFKGKSKTKSSLKLGDKLKRKKRDIIIDNLDFEQIFDKYGIEYRGKMALCPFHADSNKSLSFSNDKGLWKCWGCGEKGDIITLIKKIKEVKNGNKKEC